MLTVFVNVAYVLMLCAFLARDVLYLRGLLVVAQSIVVTYTWRNGVPLLSAWNATFVVINVTMVVQILRERRAVVLPDDLRLLYDRHFAALTPPEFLRWWRNGRRERVADAPLARAGEQPDALYFLIDGMVRVSRDRQPVADLPAGFFVAEMSLLTGDRANADVDAIGSVELMRWPVDALHELRRRDPAFWSRLQSVIGHDLVEKIRRGEHVAR
ncbi:MAG TPA: cyclic nucleotide-binding domain-containing protein [Vicinamibacterales bacterium]|jgi:CRP-like cAMP-binding protein|nr:cyclic nucleotide-binding domain-containing protein [Vicinamibacterales bacterium]